MLCAYAAAYAQTSVRVSVSDAEQQSNDNSPQAMISADGRYVTFTSFATNLVPGYGPTSGNQVFRRDLLLGFTQLVSVDDIGILGDGDSVNPKITADGRYVTFTSFATNLVSGDTNGTRDIFRRDMQTGTTIRVSVADNGDEGMGTSYTPAISANGNFIAFRSDSTNLVPGGTTGAQIFLRDVGAGTTALVSKSSLGLPGDADSGFFNVDITPDGRFVAFCSLAANLVSGDTNNAWDVYVHDRQLNSNRRISLAINGLQGFGTSACPSMSDDGRLVAFASTDGYVNGDSNGTWDVFVRDVVANTMIRASVDSRNKQGNGASGYQEAWGVRISGNGSRVAFVSSATNLVSGDTNGVQDVFVRIFATNKTEMISLNTAKKPANGASSNPSLSLNGQYTAFVSAATNIVSGDSNGFLDVFRRG
ncbi:MAG TPA: hypothetical protein PLX06_00555 [Fimbriimonadaceae bacterium]|nr:hypothetical protein [Fimbriimonadaceae bacterium]